MSLLAASSILTSILPIIFMVYVLFFLLNAKVYGTTILSPASKTLPQRSLNITSGNNSYLLMSNKSGNLEILSISGIEAQKIFNKLGGSDNNTTNPNFQIGVVVPISVAIIGGVAATWNFFQARWSGRYFQKLILEELRELSPGDTDRRDGSLKSHMKKQFIHRSILDKETENKDLILTTNHKLIYHTKQLWNAFDRDEVATFLKHLGYISQETRCFSYTFSNWKIRKKKKYDKKDLIEKVYKEWEALVKKYPELCHSTEYSSRQNHDPGVS